MMNLLIRILHKLDLLKYFNLCGSKRIQQKKVQIPVLGGIGIHNLFEWEPWMTSLMKIVTQIDGRQFVDVGANVGQSLLKIKSVQPDINYIGFEPNPACNY